MERLAPQRAQVDLRVPERRERLQEDRRRLLLRAIRPDARRRERDVFARAQNDAPERMELREHAVLAPSDRRFLSGTGRRNER
jgi:hypothetical protein